MARFQLLPGARGVDLPDGSSVQADRRGIVNVSDAQASAIKGSSAARRYDAVFELAPARGFSSRDEFTCPTCGFAPWPWATECSKCGAAFGLGE
jgi:hypothetical protein